MPSKDGPTVRVVWKFRLLSGLQIPMPKGAKVLTVQYQLGVGPCIWADVDPHAPLEDRVFAETGTGGNIPLHGKYVGTWQEESGALVCHLWEVVPNA